jgi:hypothetical protein
MGLDSDARGVLTDIPGLGNGRPIGKLLVVLGKLGILGGLERSHQILGCLSIGPEGGIVLEGYPGSGLLARNKVNPSPSIPTDERD